MIVAVKKLSLIEWLKYLSDTFTSLKKIKEKLTDNHNKHHDSISKPNNSRPIAILFFRCHLTTFIISHHLIEILQIKIWW